VKNGIEMPSLIGSLTRLAWLCCALLAFTVQLPRAVAQALSAATEVEFEKVGDGVGALTRPGLLVVLIDTSGSMRMIDAPAGAIPGGGGGASPKLWNIVQDDLPKQIARYVGAAGSAGFELRIYTFNSNVADWTRPQYPLLGGPPRVVTKGTLDAVTKDVRGILNQKPDGGTALFRSLSAIGSGLTKQIHDFDYSWSRWIIYSDGLDDGDPRLQKKFVNVANLPADDREVLQRALAPVGRSLPGRELCQARNHETIIAGLTKGVMEGLDGLFKEFLPDIPIQVVDGTQSLPSPPEVWGLKRNPEPVRLPDLSVASRTVRLNVKLPVGSAPTDLLDLNVRIESAPKGLQSVRPVRRVVSPGVIDIDFSADDKQAAAQSGGEIRLICEPTWAAPKPGGASDIKRPKSFEVLVSFASVQPLPTVESLALRPQAVKLGDQLEWRSGLDASKVSCEWTLKDESGAIVAQAVGPAFKHLPKARGLYSLSVVLTSQEAKTLPPKSGSVKAWVIDSQPRLERPAGNPIEGEPYTGVRAVDEAALPPGATATWKLQLDDQPARDEGLDGSVREIVLQDAKPHELRAIRVIQVAEVSAAPFVFPSEPVKIQADPKVRVQVLSCLTDEGRAMQARILLLSGQKARRIRLSFQLTPGLPIVPPAPVDFDVPAETDSKSFDLPQSGSDSRVMGRAAASIPSDSSVEVLAEVFDAKGVKIAEDRIVSSISPFRLRLIKSLSFRAPKSNASLVAGGSNEIALGVKSLDELGAEDSDKEVLRTATVTLHGKTAAGQRVELGSNGTPIPLDAAGEYAAVSEFATPEQRSVKSLHCSLSVGNVSIEPECQSMAQAEIKVEVRIRANIEVKIGDKPLYEPYVGLWDGEPPLITVKPLGNLVTMRAESPVAVRAAKFQTTVDGTTVTLKPTAEYDGKEKVMIDYFFADGSQQSVEVKLEAVGIQSNTVARTDSGDAPVEVDGAVALEFITAVTGARTSAPWYEYSIDSGATWTRYDQGQTIPAPPRGARDVQVREVAPVPAIQGNQPWTKQISSFRQYAPRSILALIGVFLGLTVFGLGVFVFCVSNDYAGCRYAWRKSDSPASSAVGKRGRILFRPFWNWFRKIVRVPIPNEEGGRSDYFLRLSKGGEYRANGVYERDRKVGEASFLRMDRGKVLVSVSVFKEPSYLHINAQPSALRVALAAGRWLTPPALVLCFVYVYLERLV
jgi:hypothetical protein